MTGALSMRACVPISFGQTQPKGDFRVWWIQGTPTGKPVGGASVAIYNTTGVKTFSGTTNNDGLLRLPGTKKLTKSGQLTRRPTKEQLNAVIGGIVGEAMRANRGLAETAYDDDIRDSLDAVFADDGFDFVVNKGEVIYVNG